MKLLRKSYDDEHQSQVFLCSKLTIGNVIHSALPINPPITEQLPSEWWDTECDKSLLVGTWKLGYENYMAMRSDPTLCFLSRCGPPSDRELQMATSNTQPSTPAL